MREAANFLSTALDGPRWMQRASGRRAWAGWQAAASLSDTLPACLPLSTEVARVCVPLPLPTGYEPTCYRMVILTRRIEHALKTIDLMQSVCEKSPVILYLLYFRQTAPCKTILAQNPPSYCNRLEMERVKI